MSDFLHSLVAKYLDPVNLIEPRLASRFEPAPTVRAAIPGVAEATAEMNEESAVDAPAPSAQEPRTATASASPRPGQFVLSAMPASVTDFTGNPNSAPPRRPSTRADSEHLAPMAAHIVEPVARQAESGPGPSIRPAAVAQVSTIHPAELADWPLSQADTPGLGQLAAEWVHPPSLSAAEPVVLELPLLLKSAEETKTALLRHIAAAVEQTTRPPSALPPASGPSLQATAPDRMHVEPDARPARAAAAHEKHADDALVLETRLPIQSDGSAAVKVQSIIAQPTVTPVLAHAGPEAPSRWSTLPAMARPATEQEAPTVHVMIGRIEVKAMPPPPAPVTRRSASSIMSLEEYLRQRSGGGKP